MRHIDNHTRKHSLKIKSNKTANRSRKQHRGGFVFFKKTDLETKSFNEIKSDISKLDSYVTNYKDKVNKRNENLLIPLAPFVVEEKWGILMNVFKITKNRSQTPNRDILLQILGVSEINSFQNLMVDNKFESYTVKNDPKIINGSTELNKIFELLLKNVPIANRIFKESNDTEGTMIRFNIENSNRQYNELFIKISSMEKEQLTKLLNDIKDKKVKYSELLPALTAKIKTITVQSVLLNKELNGKSDEPMTQNTNEYKNLSHIKSRIEEKIRQYDSLEIKIGNVLGPASDVVRPEPIVATGTGSALPAGTNENWITKFMGGDSNYNIMRIPGDGDCFFTTIVEAFKDKKTYTQEQLREMLAGSVTEQDFTSRRSLYNELKAADKTVDINEIFGPNFDAIDSLEKYKGFIKTKDYWADELAISRLERLLNIKIIVLSERDNNLKCVIADENLPNPFLPEYYIITTYSGNHYELVTYESKRIFNFSDLPAALVNKINNKPGCGAFSLIAEFKTNP